MSEYTKVRNYTSEELINKMRSLPSFRVLPEGYHLIAVRSNEDTPDVYDDKVYLFNKDVFVLVSTCTTNSGTYGQRNFNKWNRKGVAVTKADEVYYDSFMKSDGKYVRHHNGKMQCLRQIGDMVYYRDNNKNNRIEERGQSYKGNYSTNIHANSYKHRTGLLSWIIGRWSTGCLVFNNLSMYYLMLSKIEFNRRITYTLLNEF